MKIIKPDPAVALPALLTGYLKEGPRYLWKRQVGQRHLPSLFLLIIDLNLQLGSQILIFPDARKGKL